MSAHVHDVGEDRALGQRPAPPGVEVPPEIHVREDHEPPDVQQGPEDAVALVAHRRRDVVGEVVLHVVHGDVMLHVPGGNAEQRAHRVGVGAVEPRTSLEERPVHRVVQHQDDRRLDEDLDRPEHRRHPPREPPVQDGDHRDHHQEGPQRHADEHRVSRIVEQALGPALERGRPVGGRRRRVLHDEYRGEGLGQGERFLMLPASGSTPRGRCSGPEARLRHWETSWTVVGEPSGPARSEACT